MPSKILIALGLALFLASCGKVSKPIPPKDSTYPRTYTITLE